MYSQEIINVYTQCMSVLQKQVFILGSYANLNLEKKSIKFEDYTTKRAHNGEQEILNISVLLQEKKSIKTEYNP